MITFLFIIYRYFRMSLNTLKTKILNVKKCTN